MTDKNNILNLNEIVEQIGKDCKWNCYSCGENIFSKGNWNADELKLCEIWFNRGEINYPREPDIPAEFFVTCKRCSKNKTLTEVLKIIEKGMKRLENTRDDYYNGCLDTLEALKKSISEVNK